MSTGWQPVVGSAAFLVVGGPAITAGLGPWLLTRWNSDDPPLSLRALGVAFLLVGAALVLETTARFAFQGRGTPMPWASPRRLVARGTYRVVRNPMYVGVLALIVGQALVLGRELLFAYATVVFAVIHLFVLFHEEPALRQRFGADYESYCARVGRWLPRFGR